MGGSLRGKLFHELRRKSQYNAGSSYTETGLDMPNFEKYSCASIFQVFDFWVIEADLQ